MIVGITNVTTALETGIRSKSSELSVFIVGITSVCAQSRCDTADRKDRQNCSPCDLRHGNIRRVNAHHGAKQSEYWHVHLQGIQGIPIPLSLHLAPRIPHGLSSRTGALVSGIYLMLFCSRIHINHTVAASWNRSMSRD